MRAAVLTGYGEPLDVADVDPPDPDPDGAVVAVASCGICRSDWHAWMGHGEWNDDQVPEGTVLGHEPAGRVVAVGEQVTGLEAGDRVAVPFNLGDGTCPQCRAGHGNQPALVAATLLGDRDVLDVAQRLAVVGDTIGDDVARDAGVDLRDQKSRLADVLLERGEGPGLEEGGFLDPEHRQEVRLDGPPHRR
jgi:threonine dehydrogenase-like Zn-dependent dehydrogenase